MKRLICLAVTGVFVAGSLGCNMSWPSCFCNRSKTYDYCDTGCDPCETYYAPNGSSYEYAPSMAPPRVESLPTPGPDAST